MKILVLDLETHYDRGYSLTKLTIPEYVDDPRFHTHGLGIRWPNGRAEFRTDVPAAVAELKEKFGGDLETVTVACHNAAFDLYILNHVYGLRPRFVIDTMLLAHHVHGRRGRGGGQGASLKDLAKLYGLPAKEDLDFMQGVRNPSVGQLAQLTDYAKRDIEITAALAEKLLPQITRPEIELRILIHSVRSFTERSIKIDIAGIDPIIEDVKAQTAEVLSKVGATAKDIAGNTTFTSLLEQALAKTGRKLPMKAGKRGPVPATARNDAAMQALLDDDDLAVAALAAARLGLKSEDQLLARLEVLRRIATATGGYLPISLVYYGAHTGRFAGGGGFNIQNLGRSGIGGRIRGLLVPRPGHAFVIADLAQIEARITAWCAGQDDLLAAFRDRRDIYSEFASQTLRREVRKPKTDDPPKIRSQMDALRTVGKQAVLGLGFGMGALKFMNTLRAEPKVAGLFDAGTLSPKICRDIVREFRSTYPAIPQLWRDLEEAARASVDGGAEEVRHVRFDRIGDLTRLWLPSGRALRYSKLRLEDHERTIRFLNNFGEEDQFVPEGPGLVYDRDTALYGGKLAENIAQAIARDILVEAILRLEQKGWPVLFHVHDEVVLEVRQEQAAAADAAVAEELCRSPAWAPDLPIACETRVADRYGK